METIINSHRVHVGDSSANHISHFVQRRNGEIQMSFRYHAPANIEPDPHRQYPPRIQELIKSLTEARETIRELSDRLLTAYQERRRLEIEWAAYQSSLSPIRTCPPEVLSMIFRLYLAENPRRVRRLLLVCKQWHEIAVKDPRLWNVISLHVPELQWDLQSMVHSRQKHRQKCVERSGASLLNIDLECHELRSTRDQILERIKGSFAGDISDDDEDMIVSNWIAGLNVDALDTSEFTVKCQPNHIFKAIQQLTGADGEIMDRWGSLWLSLPQFDEQLAAKVWKLFNFPARRLTQLTIRVYNFNRDYPDVEEMTGTFPDLSGLKHLDVEKLYIFRSLILNHSSIESLVLHQGVVAWPLFQLSRFTHLQTLVVHPGFDLSNPSDKLDVTLPALREISFIGNVRHLGEVRFHTAILRDIYFVDRSSRDINDIGHALPGIQGLHVHWSEVAFWNSGWKEEDLQKEIKTFIGHFDKAKQFTVSEGARKTLISTVRLLHSCGALSPDLERIGWNREGEGAEIVDVQGLLASKE